MINFKKQFETHQYEEFGLKEIFSKKTLHSVKRHRKQVIEELLET